MGIAIEDDIDLNNPSFPLTEKDHQVLCQTDEQFKPHTWGELTQIIGKQVFKSY